MAAGVGEVARYWLAEHPAIVGFRWSPSGGLWFSTWAFLLGFLAAYITLSLTLDAALRRVANFRDLSRLPDHILVDLFCVRAPSYPSLRSLLTCLLVITDQ